MERRLAAILAADVVGYSRLIGADEAGTLTMLRALRKDLVEPTLKRHHGRVVKFMGDGLLAEFASVVDAVAAAVEIQQATPERSAHLAKDQRIALRIGVNIGDVAVEDGDLFGDGVNIAARLQEIADPGGVAISEGAHRELRGKLNLPFADAGEKFLKNIAEPMQTWTWSQANTSIDVPQPDAPLSLPDKPSIAVLPFDNLSGDPEQEFFADGMTEDIITGLSKFDYLFVIARNSTFTYKGQAIDIRAVASDLGVRYVLEGSIRRGGTRIRVTAQLIDAETGNHLWAERYDRSLADIFEVQDEVTAAIIGAIAPEIDQAEIERAKRKPPESMDAWGLYQKGIAYNPSGEAADLEAAIALFDAAREADPNFTDALAMAAYARLRFAFYYPSKRADLMVDKAQTLLQAALRQDRSNAICLFAQGWLHMRFEEFDLAISSCREAIALNPNSAMAHHELGVNLGMAGRYEEVLEVADIADRLSPRDPRRSGRFTQRAVSCFMLERFDESASWARRATRSENPRYWADAILVAALFRLGREMEMEAAKKTLLTRKPDFLLSDLDKIFPSDFIDAVRESGLSE